MPRIPRAEPEMRSPMHDQPMLAGDGWTAPGRAMQQLGQGIQSFGKGLAGLLQDQDKEAERQELHEAKLAALELRNAQDADDIKARTEYTGDGRDYGEDRTNVWASRAQPFMERWGASSRPSVQRFAQTFAAETTGIVRERAMTYGNARYVEHLFSRDREAIDRGFSLMDTPEAVARYKEDPAAFEADLARNIENANRIIADAPYRDGKQDQLRDLAGAAAAAQINSGKVPAGSVINSVRERVQKLLAPPQTPGAAPGAAPGPQGAADPSLFESGKSSRPAHGWASRNRTWVALDPYQKAAAMAIMEADGRDPEAAKNALGAMINRAAKGKEDLGRHVSGAIYQPTMESAQEARLLNIVRSRQFQELTGWARRRAAGQEADPVNGATHFLARESTMLQLEAREPQKYRSWRSWTGFNEATGYKGVILRDRSHAFLAPEGAYSYAGSVQPQPARVADAGPSRVFFDGDRNLTKPEIDQLIEKHGPNIVIGGDPSNPGFKESMAYAREKGAKVHAYDAGPGESLIVGGDEAGRISVRGEADHAAIRKRGVSVTDWQGGKWLAAQREQLLAAKKEGAEPYAIDWDNVAKTKSPSEVRDLLADQSKWAKENGISTKIAARDFSARHWQAINAGIAAGKIDRNIIAPYGFAGDGPEGEVKAAETEAQKAGVATFRMSRTAARHAAPSEGFERKPLHIPTAGGGMEVAGGGPSVESALARRLRQQLPALELRYRREVEGQIASIEADANTGAVPSEGTIARISRQVDDIGDRGLAARFANALVTGQINAEFKQQPPAVIDAALQRMLAQAARDGVQVFPKSGRTVGGGEGEAPIEEGLDPVTATTRKRIEALTKLRDTMIAELKKDPYEWATKAGRLPALPPITSESYGPEILAARSHADALIGAFYGNEYRQVFRPAEVEALRSRWESADKRQLIADMGTLVSAFGARSVKALAEIEKAGGNEKAGQVNAVAMAALGQMVLAGSSNRTKLDLADAIVLRRTPGFKSLAPPENEARAAMFEVAKTGLMKRPDVAARAGIVADLLYDARAPLKLAKGDAASFNANKELWKQAFLEALGENTDDKGTKYGGLARTPGTLWGDNPMGKPVLLPPNVRQTALGEIMRALRREDFVKPHPDTSFAGTAIARPSQRPETVFAGDPEMPLDAAGKPISMATLARGSLVVIGPGRYMVAMGDPASEDPQWVGSATEPDGYFKIDLNELEPILRQRLPSAYRPY